MRFKDLLALACAATLMAGCNNRTSNTAAGNRNETDTTGTAGSSVSASDRNWVSDQLSGGRAEVEFSKIAKGRASNPEVKQFAEMMIADHTRAGDELRQIASTYAIPQDVRLDDRQQNLIDRLSKLSGNDFDKQYMDAMVDDHEAAVRALRSRVDEGRTLGERLTGKNPENPATAKPEKAENHADAAINQWAADTLPTVERHLDRAKEIEDALDHNRTPAL